MLLLLLAARGKRPARFACTSRSCARESANPSMRGEKLRIVTILLHAHGNEHEMLNYYALCGRSHTTL